MSQVQKYQDKMISSASLVGSSNCSVLEAMREIMHIDPGKLIPALFKNVGNGNIDEELNNLAKHSFDATDDYDRAFADIATYMALFITLKEKTPMDLVNSFAKPLYYISSHPRSKEYWTDDHPGHTDARFCTPGKYNK